VSGIANPRRARNVLVTARLTPLPMISIRCALLLGVGLNGLAPFSTLAASHKKNGGFWDDRPLKIIQTSAANFPPNLAFQGISEGQVRAVISIDADGKFADALVTGYTDFEFAREVITRLQDWEYEAPVHRGQPVGTRADVVFSFTGQGLIMSGGGNEAVNAHMRRLMGPQMISVVATATELDQPLSALKVVNPRHPGKALPPDHLSGSAVIDFYVDSEGRPRMPVAIRASHDWYAIAAIQALSEWRFPAPTRDGRPVAVRLRQEFIFRQDS
jgi:hypothetical protein